MNEIPRELSQRPNFRVILAPTPRCADPIKALRQALKFAHRACDLRAISVEEVMTHTDGLHR
jgi:hypothetical protein